MYWHTPVIGATWDIGAGDSQVQDQPGQFNMILPQNEKD